ncbi:MAG: nucleotidyltransferase family protein [Pyrinomonadaceae bacterium]
MLEPVRSQLVLGDLEQFLLTAGTWAAGGTLPPGVKAHPPSLESQRFRHLLTLRAVEEKMLPMLFCFLKDQGWPVLQEIELLNEFFRLSERLLYQALDSAFGKLTQNDIPFLVLKGADISSRSYTSRPDMPRMMRDLDILVMPTDVSQAKQILEDHDFRQGRADRNTLTISPFSRTELAAFEQMDHYELPPFYKFIEVSQRMVGLQRTSKYRNPYCYFATLVQDRVFVRVKCDLHFNLSKGIDLQDLWGHTDEITLKWIGRRVQGQSMSDLIWILSSRLYHEVFQSAAVLRQFVDLIALISCCHPQIDWARVLQAAVKYELRPSLYYVFSHLNEFLADTKVPREVIEACYPARSGVRRDHDWGDFMPRLLRSVVITPLIGTIGR